MKKLLSFLLVSSLLLCPAAAIEIAPEPLVAQDAVELSSPCAALIEKSTGALIYSKNAHERGAPASVTKVMTMLLIVEAIDAGQVQLSDMVSASARAASMGGSQIWLEEGESMSVAEMLKCIAVVSANDCAVAMAEHIAGSESAFVTLMNERAEALGLLDTHFTNCTGLFDDPKHYTTAYDLAVMSRELIGHELIKDYTTIWTDTVREGRFGLTNTNKLVRNYEGCTGLKTGYTSTAMYCLSATAEREGLEFIAVIMHGESIEKRNDDAKALLSFGFANYSLCPLRAEAALPPVRVELGVADSVQPAYTGEAALLLKKGEAQNISYSLDLPESIAAPVDAGQELGRLSVFSGTELLAEVTLVAESEVARLGIFGVLRLMLDCCFSAA